MKLWFKKKVFFLIVLTAFQHLPHWPSMALVLENRHWFLYINIEDLYSEIWKRKWPSHIYMKMKMIRNNLCIPSVNINLKTRTHWTCVIFFTLRRNARIYQPKSSLRKSKYDHLQFYLWVERRTTFFFRNFCHHSSWF